MAQTLTTPDRQSILVPVDFSSASTEALLFATQLAGCSSKPLIVIHIVHEGANGRGYPRENAMEQILPLEDIAEKMLKNYMADMRARYPDNAVLASAETMVISGLPATRIPEIAHRTGASLIVMGSNGRSSLAKLIAGSVSAKVIRKSPVPVTVVHANGTVREHGKGDKWDQGNIDAPQDGRVKLRLVT
jgi:nucleotide-binding universal stress UspA family protein